LHQMGLVSGLQQPAFPWAVLSMKECD
jgi:hypothetical protein